MLNRQSRNLLILIAVVALAARFAVIWPRIGGAVDDPDHYVDLAHSIMRSHTFAFIDKPTAYRPPLYPLLLAPFVESGHGKPSGPLLSKTTDLTWPIAIFHLLLGAGTAIFASIAARRFGMSSRSVLIVGLIIAFDPLLVIQSRSIMTETLAAFLVSWAIAAAARGGTRSAIETGFVLGLAALCRPSLLAGSAVAMLFLAGTGPGLWRRRISETLILGSMILVTLLPWAIRNRLVFGEFVWTTTHGGYTFALANNPDYYRDVLNGPPGSVWDETKQRGWALEISQLTDGLSEPAADRRLTESGWRMLRKRPHDFLRASIARIGRFWAVAPSPSVYGPMTRLAAASWNIPLFLLAIIGLARGKSWRWPLAIIPAIAIGLSVVHCLYWTDMRMRAPMIPGIALAVGLGLSGSKKISQENPES